MSPDHSYDVSLQWEHDRKGILSAPELTQRIEVATPPDFPKGMPGIWSPEHLFVAAASSCLMTTFLAIAENSKLEYNAFACDAKGVVDKLDGKFQVTEIVLRPRVTVQSETLLEKTQRILEMSERNCLISNSMKTLVRVEAQVELAEVHGNFEYR
ncbi:MAG: OsmC family protein [Bacteroidetes bacterium]|nr:OsmC family protein [Bacteroidota bacterium]